MHIKKENCIEYTSVVSILKLLLHVCMFTCTTCMQEPRGARRGDYIPLKLEFGITLYGPCEPNLGPLLLTTEISLFLFCFLI